MGRTNNRRPKEFYLFVSWFVPRLGLLSLSVSVVVPRSLPDVEGVVVVSVVVLSVVVLGVVFFLLTMWFGLLVIYLSNCCSSHGYPAGLQT